MRRRYLILGVIAALLAGVTAGLYAYLHSDGFHRRVQASILHAIEQRSGVRASAGGVDIRLWPVQIRLRDLVLHGRENAQQPPLAVIPAVQLRLSLTTLWRRELRLAGVTIEQPVINIYRLNQGGSNLPQLPVLSGRDSLLFSLHIGRLEVRGGELRLNDRRLPLDVVFRGLDLSLQARPGDSSPSYRGRLRLAGLDRWNGPLPSGAGLDATFTLRPGEIEFEQLEAGGRGLHVRAQGRVIWPAPGGEPVQMQMHGEASLNWAQIDPAGLRHWLGSPLDPLPAAGLVHVAVAGAGSAAGWRLGGNTAISGWRLRRGSNPWRGQGQFLASSQGLAVPDLSLTSATGAVRLHGAYRNWRELRVDATTAGLELGELDPWLLPALQRYGLDASATDFISRLRTAVSGEVRVTGSGLPRQLRVEALNLNLQMAPAAARLGEAAPTRTVPVGGRLRATLQPAARRLQIAALDASLAGVQLQLAGTVASASGGPRLQLQMEAQSQNWSGWQPVMARLLARPLPAFGGAGSIRGTLQGPWRSPTFNGQWSLTQVAWAQYRFDRIEGQGQVGPQGVQLRSLLLQQGQARLEASGTVALEAYRLAPASAIGLSVNARNLAIAHVVALAGYHPSPQANLAGRMDVQARFQGSWAQPEASGRVVVRQARGYGQPVRALSADFRLRQGVLRSADVSMELAHTRIGGEVAIGLHDHTYALNLASAAVDLSDVAPLQSPRLAIGGRLRFQLSGRGSWDHPQGSLVLTTIGLHGGGETLGDVGAQLQLAAGTLTVQAADILPNGSFNVEGTVAAAYPWRADLRFHLRDYDFDAWLRRFTPAELSGHSHVSGSASLSGPLADPAQLTAQAAIDPVELAIGGLQIHNQTPVRLRLLHRQLTLEPTHIVAQDTDFTLSGTASLDALTPPIGGDAQRPAPGGWPSQARLEGSLQGHINLALIHALHPATQASGELLVSARLAGTAAQPDVSGQIAVHDASLSEEDLPIGFDRIEGRLRLQGDRVQIAQLTAQTGGGRLTISGFASRARGVTAFDLDAHGEAMRLRYQGISATGNLQLRLAGQSQAAGRPAGALLSGEAQLNRIGLDRHFDLAVLLAQMQTPSPPPSADSVLNRIGLDVHLTTGPEVEVVTNLTRLQLQADLHLGGTLASPSLLGRASTGQGQILFAGNQYRVTKAQVQFVNRHAMEPLLDVGLNTTVQQYDVSLHLSGPADRLAISYRSDPPLSSADVVALLATGAPTPATTGLSGSGSAFAGNSQQLLGQALNNLMASRLRHLFGVTQVQVNPDTGTLGRTGSGGTVTVQRQVARNLKLTYTQNLSSSSEDIIQVDWTISRTLGISLNRDQYGLYGIKFTIRHRAR